MDKTNEGTSSPNGKVTLRVASTFGNFDYVAETQVSRDVIETAANKGFLWELQRSPAGAAEFALTGFDGKTKVKPTDWTRTDIEFTEANAAVIAKALGNRANFAKGSFLPSDAKVTVTVTKHEVTAAEPKYSKERAFVAMTIQFDGIAAIQKLAKKAGYVGTQALNDSENLELFAAIAAYKAKLAATL